MYWLHSVLEPIARNNEIRTAFTPKKGSHPTFNWSNPIIRSLEMDLFLKMIPKFINWGRYVTKEDSAFLKKMKKKTKEKQKKKIQSRTSWSDVCDGEMANGQQVNFRNKTYTSTKTPDPRDADAHRETWRSINRHFQYPGIYGYKLKERVSLQSLFPQGITIFLFSNPFCPKGLQFYFCSNPFSLKGLHKSHTRIV